jgi:hypothetical protein
MRQSLRAAPEDTGLFLDPDTCWELLGGCGGGTLAATARAMPTVVPVSVSVWPAGICLGFADRAAARLFAGQIVALGAGVAATPRTPGWWVVARGELGRLTGTRTHLLLDVRELDGRSLPEGLSGR